MSLPPSEESQYMTTSKSNCTLSDLHSRHNSDTNFWITWSRDGVRGERSLTLNRPSTNPPVKVLVPGQTSQQRCLTIRHPHNFKSQFTLPQTVSRSFRAPRRFVRWQLESLGPLLLVPFPILGQRLLRLTAGNITHPGSLNQFLLLNL